MKRVRVPIGLWTATLVALGAMMALEIQRQRHPLLLAGLTPVRVAFPPDRKDLRASFTAVWSEPHYVSLAFPSPVADPGLERLLSLAEGGSAPEDVRRAFDYEWRALEGGIEVGRGSGRSWKGSFGGRARAILSGDFPTTAGRDYVIEVRRGPEFDRLLPAAPSLEVGVNNPHPSLALPIEEAIIPPLQLLVGTVGVIPFLWSVVVTRQMRRVRSG